MKTFKFDVQPAVDSLMSAEWSSKEFYAEYMAQTYYYVFYACRMLAAAAAGTGHGDEAYYQRLVAHIKEEAGHERLALLDLKNLGGDIENYPELGITRALWEPQFFKTQRSPISLMGYVLALEMAAAKFIPEKIEELNTLYGPKCTHFFRVHGEEDPAHVEKALEQVKGLNGPQFEEVCRNFDQTVEVLVCFTDRIAVSAEQRLKAQHRPTHGVRRAS